MTLDALRPRGDAARLAAAIRALDARVRIADLFTLERMPAFVSREVLNALPAPISDGSGVEQIDFSQRALTPFYVAAAMHAVRTAIAEARPDCVVFLTHSRFESRVARTIASNLRLPDSCLVANGELSILASRSVALTELLTAAVTRSSHTGGDYGPETYPALRDETKLRVFDIGTDLSTADSVSGLFTVLEESAALNRCYGTRAFHLGRSVAGNQFYHLASELVTRNSHIRYSVNAAMSDYPAEFAAVAAASGCVAASFQVGTGSQRLLEQHYSYEFKLHLAERTIRKFAEAGIHTRVELSYPCAVDDFHTRDETVRFIGRCLPHAVRVDAAHDPARTTPSSLWRPSERRRRSLERALHSLGAAPDMRPIDALLASLAGFPGRERQFRNHAARALATGNIDALGALVETINAAAAGHSETMFWRAFGADQRMVGN